jgi:hypothetical protein
MQSIYLNRQANLYDRLEDDPEQLGGYLGVSRDEEGFFQRWAIVFINFDEHSYGFEFWVKGMKDSKASDVINAKEIVVIEGLATEKLMAQPDLQFSIAQLNTEGDPNYHAKKIKVKKKHLIQEGSYNASLDLHLIPLFEFPWPIKKTKKGDLKAHTQHLSEQAQTDSPKANFDYRDPVRKAGFSDKIDLHAWALVDEPKDYTAAELFILQLERLEAYLDEAIQVGFDKVTIIHGIGKGRLKEEIFRRLHKHPYVKDYSNEYHPDHKFGATEVYLE